MRARALDPRNAAVLRRRRVSCASGFIGRRARPRTVITIIAHPRAARRAAAARALPAAGAEVCGVTVAALLGRGRARRLEVARELVMLLLDCAEPPFLQREIRELLHREEKTVRRGLGRARARAAGDPGFRALLLEAEALAARKPAGGGA